jgi:hypothetical protein
MHIFVHLYEAMGIAKDLLTITIVKVYDLKWKSIPRYKVYEDKTRQSTLVLSLLYALASAKYTSPHIIWGFINSHSS